MTGRSARVLVCRPGTAPQEIRMPSDMGHPGGLTDIIGSVMESVALAGGVSLWCSMGALYPGPGLVLNRRVPRDPELPRGKNAATPERLAAQAHLEVHGAFVLARGNAEAGLDDLTDEDVERFTRWFELDAQARR